MSRYLSKLDVIFLGIVTSAVLDTGFIEKHKQMYGLLPGWFNNKNKGKVDAEVSLNVNRMVVVPAQQIVKILINLDLCRLLSSL